MSELLIRITAIVIMHNIKVLSQQSSCSSIFHLYHFSYKFSQKEEEILNQG